MNKRHPVYYLLFAGVMSVGLGQGRAISSEHATGTKPAQTVQMQTHQARRNNETPMSDSGSPSNVEEASHSSWSTDETALFGGDIEFRKKNDTVGLTELRWGHETPSTSKPIGAAAAASHSPVETW